MFTDPSTGVPTSSPLLARAFATPVVLAGPSYLARAEMRYRAASAPEENLRRKTSSPLRDW